MKKLVGKRTLVTGAASPLGKAVVEKFVEHGAMVVATDTTDERVERAIDALGLAESNDVITRALDESDLGSWWDLANLIAAYYDELDTLVHIPQIESADSLPMAIDRLKPALLAAEAANPGQVAVVLISDSAEGPAETTALELSQAGSKLRVESVQSGPATQVAEIVLELSSPKGIDHE